MSVPANEPYVVFGKPDIGEAEIAEVVDSLRSGWVGKGPKTARFEENFSSYLGAKFAVGVNSCTAALHVSLIAAGIGPGDEVITTAMTFCATVNAIIHAGATPVIVDCRHEDQCIDPDLIGQKITPRTKAIIPVHYAGNACDMDRIMAIAHQHGLLVIEDCAHAIETTYKGKHVGTFGIMGCFSFYVTKNLLTAEGGMVVTDDAKMVERLRVFSLHGMSMDAWKRFTDDGYKHYEVTAAGFKYNMFDIQAAMGIHQLKAIESKWQCRSALWQRYQLELKGLAAALPADGAAHVRHAYHLFPLVIGAGKSQVSRDKFLQLMHQKGIGTGVHYQCLAAYAFYQKTFGWCLTDYPNAARFGMGTASIPFSSALKDEEVKRVIHSVREILQHG
ncbi:MAG: DegT/DnrJ/EryC1/StrS family aminotransferase [Candidatus Omnitrophota bacterium]